MRYHEISFAGTLAAEEVFYPIAKDTLDCPKTIRYSNKLERYLIFFGKELLFAHVVIFG